MDHPIVDLLSIYIFLRIPKILLLTFIGAVGIEILKGI